MTEKWNWGKEESRETTGARRQTILGTRRGEKPVFAVLRQL